MTPLTVACVFVKGEYPYTPEYVRCLYAGVKKHLPRSFRFVCFTDQPDALPAWIEPIVVKPWQGCHTFWTKLELFNPAHDLQGRVLYLDLDTLIVGDLAPIVDFPSHFVMAADCLAPTLDGPPQRLEKGGKRWLPKFQTSVIAWDAGLCRDLYETWTPQVGDDYYTDQDWIGEAYPGASVLPLAWCPRMISEVVPPWPADAKVVLVKKPKNHVAVERYPWFAEHWRAA